MTNLKVDFYPATNIFAILIKRRLGITIAIVRKIDEILPVAIHNV